MKNEDAAWFKTKQTYSILTCSRFARRWKIHRSCVKLHQRVAPSSFALLHASVPQEFSSLSTNRKSAPFPARWCCRSEATQPLSARLQGSLRLLPFPLPASPWFHLAMDFPLAGSATGLPCSAEVTRSVRSALYAGRVVYPWQRNRKPLYSLQEEPRSILGSLRVTTLTSICIFWSYDQA